MAGVDGVQLVENDMDISWFSKVMLRGKHFPVETSASHLRNRGRSGFLNEGLPILTFQETISCCCDVPGRTCFCGPDPVKARMKCHDPRIRNSMVPTICAANFGGVRRSYYGASPTCIFFSLSTPWG